VTLRPCIECGVLTHGSRCPRHKIRRDRGRPWRRTRAAVLARNVWTCQRCGNPATTVDHITPLARGGTDDPSNLQSLCAACNGTKGDR
jgi:5-methylcytosine-specific restriction protein A